MADNKLRDIVKASQSAFNKLVAETHSETYDSDNLYEVELGDPIILGAPGSNSYINGDNELIIEATAEATEFICKTAGDELAKVINFDNFKLRADSYYPVSIVNENTAKPTSDEGKKHLTLTITGLDAAVKGDIWIDGKVSDSTNYTLPAGQYFVKLEQVPLTKAVSETNPITYKFLFRKDLYIPGITSDFNGTGTFSLNSKATGEGSVDVGNITNAGGANSIAAGKGSLASLTSVVANYSFPYTLTFNSNGAEFVHAGSCIFHRISNKTDGKFKYAFIYTVESLNIGSPKVGTTAAVPPVATINEPIYKIVDATAESELWYVYNTGAFGTNSISTGKQTLALGENSVAEGLDTVAIKSNSKAIGEKNIVAGDNSTAEGYANIVLSKNSHVEGTGELVVLPLAESAPIDIAARTIKLPSTLTADEFDIIVRNNYLIHYHKYTDVSTNQYETYTAMKIASSDASTKTITLELPPSVDNNTSTSGYWYYMRNMYVNVDNSHVEGSNFIINDVDNDVPNWDNTSDYKVGDIVKKDNKYYYCIKGFTHIETFNQAYWQLIGAIHAEGSKNTVSGSFIAHVEGLNNTVLKSFAHAEGKGNKATAYSAHAEGESNTVSGKAGHVEGIETEVSNEAGHAEGTKTKASKYAHAEGNSTVAAGEASHAEGKNESTWTDLSVSGFDTDLKKVKVTATVFYATPEGTLISHTGKTATATTDTTETTYVSSKSITGSNYYLIFPVQITNTSGSTDTGWKYLKTGASGEASHIEGHSTWTSGKYSHAEGDGSKTVAIGTVGGSSQDATAAHAEGKNTTAYGVASHTEGNNTKAYGEYSHAEGNSTAAGIDLSTKITNTWQSNHDYEVNDCYFEETSSGKLYYYCTKAHKSESSVASDKFQQFRPYGAHAEGNTTAASGDYSHVEGQGTIANYAYQHVFGKYNKPDEHIGDKQNTGSTGTYIEIVGNGTATDANKRHNARTLDWEGNEEIDGYYTSQHSQLNQYNAAVAHKDTADNKWYKDQTIKHTVKEAESVTKEYAETAYAIQLNTKDLNKITDQITEQAKATIKVKAADIGTKFNLVQNTYIPITVTEEVKPGKKITVSETEKPWLADNIQLEMYFEDQFEEKIVGEKADSEEAAPAPKHKKNYQGKIYIDGELANNANTATLFAGKHWCKVNIVEDKTVTPKVVTYEYYFSSKGYSFGGGSGGFVCKTEGNKQNKEIEAEEFVLIPNSYYSITMQKANDYSGTINLKIGSNLAKPIYINGKKSATDNKTLPAGQYEVYYGEIKKTDPNEATEYGYFFRTTENEGSIETVNYNFKGNGSFSLNRLPEEANNNSTQIGENSAAFGEGTIAPGKGAFAEGKSAEYVKADGWKTISVDSTTFDTSTSTLTLTLTDATDWKYIKKIRVEHTWTVESEVKTKEYSTSNNNTSTEIHVLNFDGPEEEEARKTGWKAYYIGYIEDLNLGGTEWVKLPVGTIEVDSSKNAKINLTDAITNVSLYVGLKLRRFYTSTTDPSITDFTNFETQTESTSTVLRISDYDPTDTKDAIWYYRIGATEKKLKGGANGKYAHVAGLGAKAGLLASEITAAKSTYAAWAKNTVYAKDAYCKDTSDNLYKCLYTHKSGEEFNDTEKTYWAIINVAADNAFASGFGTVASGSNQTVIGKFNVEDNDISGKHAFIVGNGNSDKASNAFTVDWDGGAHIGANQVAADYTVTGDELISKTYADLNYKASGYICKTDADVADKIIDFAGFEQPLDVGTYFSIYMVKTNAAESALTLAIGDPAEASENKLDIYINGKPSSATNCTLPAGQYEVYYGEVLPRTSLIAKPKYAYYFNTKDSTISDEYHGNGKVQAITNDYEGTGSFSLNRTPYLATADTALKPGTNSVAIGDNVIAKGKGAFAEGTSAEKHDAYWKALSEDAGAVSVSLTGTTLTITIADGYKLPSGDLDGTKIKHTVDSTTKTYKTAATGNSETKLIVLNYDGTGTEESDKKGWTVYYREYYVLYGGANGEYSHAEGYRTAANGKYSHVEGSNSTTLGESAHAEGLSTVAIAKYAHAEGTATITKGEASHAEGIRSSENITEYIVANTGAATALKISEMAIANKLHIGGMLVCKYHTKNDEAITTYTIINKYNDTITVDNNIKAIYTSNDSNIVDWIYVEKTTSGKGAHTEGYNTSTEDNYAHAEGNGTVAKGVAAHAEGESTLAIETTGTVPTTFYSTTALDIRASGDNIIVNVKLTDGVKPFIPAIARQAFTWTISGSPVMRTVTYSVVDSLIKADDTIDVVISSLDYSGPNISTMKAKALESWALRASAATAEITYYGADGTASHTEGSNTVATGEYSHAEGIGGSQTTTTVANTRWYPISASNISGFGAATGVMKINLTTALQKVPVKVKQYSYLTGVTTEYNVFPDITSKSTFAIKASEYVGPYVSLDEAKEGWEYQANDAVATTYYGAEGTAAHMEGKATDSTSVVRAKKLDVKWVEWRETGGGFYVLLNTPLAYSSDQVDITQEYPAGVFHTYTADVGYNILEVPTGDYYGPSPDTEQAKTARDWTYPVVEDDHLIQGGAIGDNSHAEGLATKAGWTEEDALTWIASLHNWRPNRAYVVGEQIQHPDTSVAENKTKILQCKTAYTSGDTYSAAELDKYDVIDVIASSKYANTHAQNEGTVANKKSQTAVGRYNKADTDFSSVYGKEAFIVGNGTDDLNRSDAFVVNWDGSTQIGANQLSGGYKFKTNELITKEYADVNYKGSLVCTTAADNPIKYIDLSSYVLRPEGTYLSVYMANGNTAQEELYVSFVETPTATDRKYPIYLDGKKSSSSNYEMSVGHYFMLYKEVEPKEDTSTTPSTYIKDYGFFFNTDGTVEGLNGNFKGTGKMSLNAGVADGVNSIALKGYITETGNYSYSEAESAIQAISSTSVLSMTGYNLTVDVNVLYGLTNSSGNPRKDILLYQKTSLGERVLYKMLTVTYKKVGETDAAEIGLNKQIKDTTSKDWTIVVSGITAAEHAHNEGQFNNIVYYEEGYSFINGAGSHAEGKDNMVLAQMAHVEGINNAAGGHYSHVEGGGITGSGGYIIGGNVSRGSSNHVEGIENIVVSEASHVEGMNNIAMATGSYGASHVEGSNNIVNASYAHAEGINNTTNLFTYLNSFDNNSIILNSSASTLFENTSIGDIIVSRYHYNKEFREEYYTVTKKTIPLDASGNNLYRFELNKAIENKYQIINQFKVSWLLANNWVSGTGSHKEGNSAVASGNYSHAEGSMSRAIGAGAHAEGNSVKSYRYAVEKAAEEALTVEEITLNGTNLEIKLTTARKSLTPTVRQTAGTAPVTTTYTLLSGSTAGLLIIEAATYVGPDITTPEAKLGWAYDPSSAATDTLIYQGATGSYSHAEGTSSVAIGTASHAEGNDTKAIQDYSHAEGYTTRTFGAFSHAEGKERFTIGNGSHVEGFGGQTTIDSSEIASITGNTITFASATTYSAIKLGYYLFCTALINHTTYGLMAKDAVFKVIDKDDDNYKITIDRTISGLDSNPANTIWGYFTSGAFGKYSHAEGNKTVTIGDYSHAEGDGSVATGEGAHAEGAAGGTIVTTEYKFIPFVVDSVSSGGGTTIRLNLTTALPYVPETVQQTYEGNTTLYRVTAASSNPVRLVIPSYTGPAISEEAAKLGWEYLVTTPVIKEKFIGAEGKASHAEGLATRAIGDYSHAAGTNTVAAGLCAHAEGNYSRAMADYTHVEGNSNMSIDRFLVNDPVVGATKLQVINIDEGSAGRQEFYYDGLQKYWYSRPIMGDTIMYSDDGDEIYDKYTVLYTEDDQTNKIFTVYIDRPLVHAHSQQFVILSTTGAYGMGTHMEGACQLGYGEYMHIEGYCNSAQRFNITANRTIVNVASEYIQLTISTDTLKWLPLDPIKYNYPIAYSVRYPGILFEVRSYSADGRLTLNSYDYGVFEKIASSANPDTTWCILPAWYNGGSYAHIEGHSNVALGTASHVGGNNNISLADGQYVIGKYNKPDADSPLVIGNGGDWKQKDTFTQATDLIGYWVRTTSGYHYGSQAWKEITAANCATIWADANVTSVCTRTNAFTVSKAGVANATGGFGYLDLTATGAVAPDTPNTSGGLIFVYAETEAQCGTKQAGYVYFVKQE